MVKFGWRAVHRIAMQDISREGRPTSHGHIALLSILADLLLMNKGLGVP